MASELFARCNTFLLVDVERCDDFRKGQVLSNTPGNPDLVQLEIGVRCDDGTA